MAARRLIVILVALFAISIVAAMIAPDRRGGLIGGRTTSTTERTTTTTTTTTPDALPPGESLSARIVASVAEPETVRASVGDQVGLTVASRRAREIEIPAFGVTEDAAPDAAASFNLLLREPGLLAIIDADSGALLGRLDVRGSDATGEPRGPAGDRRHRNGPRAQRTS